MGGHRFSFTLDEQLGCRSPGGPGDMSRLLGYAVVYGTGAFLHVFTLSEQTSAGMLDNGLLRA